MPFDQQKRNSRKQLIRIGRGEQCKALLRKVKANTKCPRGKLEWPNFLKQIKNKGELYVYVAGELLEVEIPAGKVLVVTIGEEVFVKGDVDLNIEAIAPSTQEEVDNRAFLHLWHMAQHGHEVAAIKGNDVDYLSNALALFPKLGLKELYVEYSSGSTKCVYPIHTMFAKFGADRCAAYAFFHPFTGGDRSSSFHSVGKITAHKTWSLMGEMTHIFNRLCDPHVFEEADYEDIFCALQKFVVACYSRHCPHGDLTKARHLLFAEGRKINNIPPAKASLREHVKRCTLDAHSTMHSLEK